VTCLQRFLKVLLMNITDFGDVNGEFRIKNKPSVFFEILPGVFNNKTTESE
jgi:hypothetical protein